MKRLDLSVLAAAGLVCVAGCTPAFERIDRRTIELLADTNTQLGADTAMPRTDWRYGSKPREQRGPDLTEEHPPTVNPPATELVFHPDGDAEEVVRRLEQYADIPPDAVDMNLTAALEYATRHSREYRFAEEDYLLEALRLLGERHLWGPRFFNDTFLEVTAIGDGGTYDSALSIVNDLRVTQRLPYGGEISAQFLAAATQDLHQWVSGENIQTADLIFNAEIPLLRGAGDVAREDLIQAERNVVYAARAFERFRREFLVAIATDFLDLVIEEQAIRNTAENVLLLEAIEQREVALVNAGRTRPFEAAQAAQTTLFRRNTLNNQQEQFRLSLDRFKVRIGMPEEQAVRILASSPRLPVPDVTVDEAVRSAMRYRLDLQNRRDFIADARRGVNNARNALLADLDLSGSVTFPTRDTSDYPGVDLDFEDPTFRAALALGLPLDRTVERLDLRQTQIDLERSIREYERFRDTVAVEVRAAVRNIDRALFNRSLQEENLRVSQLRIDSIDAAPDRANSRDRTEAATGLLGAQDQYLAARRDLQVAILTYLLDSGRLRVRLDGTILPLEGLRFRRDEPLDYGAPAGAAPGAID